MSIFELCQDFLTVNRFHATCESRKNKRVLLTKTADVPTHSTGIPATWPMRCPSPVLVLPPGGFADNVPSFIDPHDARVIPNSHSVSGVPLGWGQGLDL